ncbi:M81 family metallopeptidase [Qingshengfaniella alkalisoli]|uniref:Microcystinase C n=1 Tax=Qingshengfaniella alkalisoli TaxID=2599296 RepID=A0A5B8I9G1_9RHOB|nr:M81 family metallopeptidase [Qingshengfaniella alkalisoli]QDY70905.1 M81 family metallopeptidase [Qingshengfaniella alkalisoli]
MRIFTAALATETNTFSPIRIDLRAFAASLLARPGEHPETPTLCTAVIPVGRAHCRAKGWELIEGTSAWADPAGLVAKWTYELLRDEILDQLQGAMPVDGVVIGLHGAMVAEGYVDPEGDLLSRIRAVIGADTPLIATLDPHSHLTQRRAEAADALIYFKEFPHTDFVDRAEDAWALLGDMLQGKVRPVMSIHDCVMIDVFPTSNQPMRSFVDRMFALERDRAEVLSISTVHGFMAGDVPEMGTKLLVVTNDDAAAGQALADELGQELFAMRGQSRSTELTPAEALDKAAALKGPVVIADMWDNPGGGTAGDATVILQDAMDRNLTNIAFGSIWDPVAVQICHAAGEGAVLDLRLGAKSAPGTGNPIDARVEVVRNLKSAQQKFGASDVPIGDATLIRLDGIEVILNSTRAQCFDPSLFTIFGIDPAMRDILVVKSTNHFHAAFAPIATEILYCSAGTPYPNDPRCTPYRLARRDIWPIQETA